MGVVKTIKTLSMVNQKEGFDCPGCAWPDPEHRTTFEFCENGAKAVADEAMKARVTPAFFAQHSVQDLAQKSDYELNNLGRISSPVVLREGTSHYEAISWDDAFTMIADALNATPSPDRAVFYTSGRTSNEAAFLYQAFVRAYGTNNLPDCSNMCHESSGKGLGQTIGIGKERSPLRISTTLMSFWSLVKIQEPITRACSRLCVMRNIVAQPSSM